MSIILDGTTGITTPDIQSAAGLDAADLTGTVASARLPAGSVIQVVSTTKTDTFSTSSSGNVDITGLSVNITPTNASSKFLIFAKVSVSNSQPQNTAFVVQLVRDATLINKGDGAGNRAVGFSGSEEGISDNVYGQFQTYDFTTNHLDSPNTTNQLTYKIRFFLSQTNTIYVNRTGVDNDTLAYPRLTSNITVMEIAA